MDYPNETFAVAVSGGLDSMSLLYMANLAGLPMIALTVDHGLRPESAAEAAYVAAACKNLGIRHKILKWTGTKPRSGLEEAARKARYELMLDWCKKNNVGVLMTAHQADDQIETFLMNLGRGSGVYGLAGIRERATRDGVIIFRPLLNVPRAELKKYCEDNGIKYCEDAMNDDEEFLRVKIRKNRHVLGLTDERLLLAIENLGRMREYVEVEALKLARNIPVEFEAPMLLNAPDEVRFRALSMMLAKYYPIRLDDIKRAFGRLDGGDCKFTLGGCNIRLLNGKIRIWKEGTKWQKEQK
jgi:tRNA(Ile)-lysidine synthase